MNVSKAIFDDKEAHEVSNLDWYRQLALSA